MITHKEILALKPQNSEKRYSAERGGLYISVSPSGGRYWYYRYKFEGITAWYSLGTFNHPTMNKDVEVVMDLKSALKQFYFEKSRVANGIDIQLLRIQQREKKPEKAYTVKDIYKDWKDMRQSKVVKNTWDKELSRMERYVLPVYGDTPLLDLTTEDVYNEMKKISVSTKIGRDNRILGGFETAKRTARHFASLVDLALQFGKVQHNVVTAVAKLLPEDKDSKSNNAILDTELLGQYLHEVETDRKSGDLIGIGCRLMPHLFVRHSEMLTMKWKEIDFKKAEWNRVISKQKKMKHRVFLSKQVIALLKQCHTQTQGQEYVFHSNEARFNGHVSTLTHRLKTLGWKQKDSEGNPLERCVDVHGFRTTATSLGQDEGLGDHALIDLCVGHKSKAVHGERYDRSTRYKERKQFMQDWSDLLDRLRKETAQESNRQGLKLV